MIKKILHKFRLSRVVKELPYYLGRDIGPQYTYAVDEIKAIFNKYRLHDNYLKYAIALFSTEDEYKKEFPIIFVDQYYQCREEIARIFFDGKKDILYSDLMNVTKFKGCISYDASENNHKEEINRWSFHDQGGANAGYVSGTPGP